jgi:hypothetical protein
MNVAGGHIYTSGAFWGVAAGVIVGLLGIAATVWVTLRAANPKRRLLYSMPVVTPLLNPRPNLPDIEVRRAGNVLANPHVVSVQLTSRGRRDIAREAFDGEKPLCLDVGVPIVECLKVTTSPPDRLEPSWNIDGSRLLIGPNVSLISRRQTIDVSLLVDGESPHLSPPKQSLIDVDIRPFDPASERGLPAVFWLAGWLIVVIVLWPVEAVYLIHETGVVLSRIAASIGIGGVVLIALVLLWRRWSASGRRD